jgi:hypothetical protein
MINDGKNSGQYRGYCSQQCKGWTNVTITEADIKDVYPKGRPRLPSETGKDGE